MKKATKQGNIQVNFTARKIAYCEKEEIKLAPHWEPSSQNLMDRK